MIEPTTVPSPTAAPAAVPSAAPAPAPETRISDLELRDELADPNSNDLDKDAFLKLLVAQLRYQDPLDPSEPAEFLATTAQFTTIEKLNELTEQGANNAIVTGLSMASSLVGRTIDYVGVDDAVASGVVTSAAVVGGEVRLMTAEGAVAMETVTAIGAASQPTPIDPVPAPIDPSPDITADPIPTETTDDLAATPVVDQAEGQDT